MSADNVAISVQSLRKVYHLYDRPIDRLKQLVWGRDQQHYREFVALEDVSFELPRGEVLGLVGRNGAGKSTLLQAICGTLTPTSGSVMVRGRVAALLELGAGFNPDFTGRENVYLNAAVLGLSTAQIDERYDEIVSFSGIGDFIGQPVKTYSSGMYIRLAFAIATSVEPDILVIDEALSVGDGAFSRKSFDRIMKLKDGGATILFCSHSAYQVEALCSRALWIEKGRVRMDGFSASVIDAYTHSLELSAAEPLAASGEASLATEPGVAGAAAELPAPPATTPATGAARLQRITAWSDGVEGGVSEPLQLNSLESELRVRIEFISDPALPAPSLAYEIQAQGGHTVTSAVTLRDDVAVVQDERGAGVVELLFSRFPLMRGRYHMNFYLACERMLHVYDQAAACVNLEVQQAGLERGVVFVAHEWHARAADVVERNRD